jgi:transposase
VFKLEAVKLVTQRGVSIAQAAKDLGVRENVLRKCVRVLHEAPQDAFPWLDRQKVQDAEIARLRKEVAKLKMERDILKKPRPTARRSRCEVRLRGGTPRGLAGQSDVRGARCLVRGLLRMAGLSAYRGLVYAAKHDLATGGRCTVDGCVAAGQARGPAVPFGPRQPNTPVPNSSSCSLSKVSLAA